MPSMPSSHFWRVLGLRHAKSGLIQGESTFENSIFISMSEGRTGRACRASNAVNARHERGHQVQERLVHLPPERECDSVRDVIRKREGERGRESVYVCVCVRCVCVCVCACVRVCVCV